MGKTQKKQKKLNSAKNKEQGKVGQEEMKECVPENDKIQETHANNENDEQIEDPAKSPVIDVDKLFKIVTVNVGSLAAACKKGFIEYLNSENADIICIQETKLHSGSSPGFDCYIIDGYYGYFFNSENHKGYSGTCIYSKIQPISIKPGFNDDEGRIILIEYNNFYLVNTYVPNAGQKLERLNYKINTWTPKLSNLMDELSKNKFAILCGDLNVAHQPIDIYDTKGKEKCAGYTPEERKWFDDFLKSGYTDVFRYLYPSKQQFSFFSYRGNMKAKGYGWRLDYFVVPSKSIDDKVIVDSLILNTNFSDHSPCLLLLDKEKILSEADIPIKEPGVTVINSGAIFKKSNDNESEKKDNENDNVKNDDDDKNELVSEENTKTKKIAKSKTKKTNKRKK